MNTILIPTTQNIDLEYPIARVGDRILSAFIDLLILTAYTIVWHYFTDKYYDMISVVFNEEGAYASRTLYALLWAPAVFYSLYCEVIFRGQTLGKMLLRTRTINLDGATPGFSSMFLRWGLRLVDVWLFPVLASMGFIYDNALVVLIVLPGLVGFLFVAFTGNNQRLGDLVAGTTVIRLKLVTTFLDTIFVETSDNYEIVFPEIHKLSDRDVSILKEVLDAGLKSESPELLGKLARKVKEVTGIQSKMRDRQFLDTILADYNHFYRD